MLKRIISVLLVAFFVLPVIAQEMLEDNITVEGEITDEIFAVEYSYQGTEGQVIVLELFPLDTLSDYDRPSIILLNSEDEELMRRDGFGKTTAIYPLPADDIYTIIVSRRDDAAGISIGGYTLRLSIPPELSLDAPVNVAMTSDDTLYYIYRGEADFNLFYSRTGDFAPEVTVNTIDLRVTIGSLRASGAIYGESVTQGIMGTFEGDNLYVIKLGSAIFSFNFGSPSANVTLELFEP